MKVKVELEGRDFLEVECTSIPGPVTRVSFMGCTEFMSMMQSMRKNFGVDISKWPLPETNDHGAILLREMILKLRGEWDFPYKEDEVCHCRTVATHTVDQAVIAGAHSTDKVTRQTSLSTACGTCRPEVQKIIDYRLGKKTA